MHAKEHLPGGRERVGVANARFDVPTVERRGELLHAETGGFDGGVDVDRQTWDPRRDDGDSAGDHRERAQLVERSSDCIERFEKSLLDWLHGRSWDRRRCHTTLTPSACFSRVGVLSGASPAASRAAPSRESEMAMHHCGRGP